MKQSIAIIKAYANDSLAYGKRANNANAIKRGNEVLFALNKIEEELDKVHNLQKLILINQRSLLYVEADFAKRIDPGNYDTLDEWKVACREVREEINA